MLVKLITLSAVVCLALGGLIPAQPAKQMVVGQVVDESHHIQFTQYKNLYNKQYASQEEELMRFATFVQSLKFIAEHNARHEAGEETFTVNVNQFADMTNEEFRQWLGQPQSAPSMGNASEYLELSNIGALPTEVDWRTKGYVTPVKDQGQCGSCWSFSATGSLEGQHFKKNGELVSLSEQNLVDCATGKYGNQGCNGGWPFQAYDYIKANGGIDTESSYPYEAKDDQCRYKAANSGATLVSYTKLTKGSESALQQAVATIGPISIAIDASHMSFQLYSSGVYTEPKCSSSRLDHAVLAVGYGTESKGGDYWLVKNSWNSGWGLKGYIMMSRNKNNQCGVASAAVYPHV